MLPLSVDVIFFPFLLGFSVTEFPADPTTISRPFSGFKWPLLFMVVLSSFRGAVARQYRAAVARQYRARCTLAGSAQ